MQAKGLICLSYVSTGDEYCISYGDLGNCLKSRGGGI